MHAGRQLPKADMYKLRAPSQQITYDSPPTDLIGAAAFPDYETDSLLSSNDMISKCYDEIMYCHLIIMIKR